jgi:hypothetical protein
MPLFRTSPARVVLGLLAICVVVFSDGAAGHPAQPGTVAVPAIPRWRVGDVREVDVVRTVEERVNVHMVTASGRITSRLRMTVLAADAEGSVIEWRFVETGKPAKLDPRGKLVAFDIERQLERLTLEIEFDATGRPQGVRNLKSLRGQMDGVCAAIAKILPAEKRPEFLSEMRTTIADDAKLTEILLAEATILFGPIGERLTIGQPTTIRPIIFTPAMGKARGSGKRSLEIDLASSTATVASTATADYSIKGKTRSLKADSEERSEHVFDRVRGWPVKVRHRQLARFDAAQRIAGLWYTLAPATGAGPATADAK